VTSNGTAAGSALVWIIWSPDGSGANAQLRAYDAAPATSPPTLLFSAPIGTAAKFAPPGLSSNRLFVGTRDGNVLCFGAPAP
jgi:iron transport multicopper oxidase